MKRGALALFDWLDATRTRRAVATSTRSVRAKAKLERAGLWTRVDACVGGDEIARGKPAPDIVLAAAAKLGVDASRPVVVEDSEPGVRAAIAAGAAPMMVPDLLAPSPEVIAAGVPVFDTLDDVRAHLDALPCVR